MLLQKPQAVIFDMDGLILDTEPIYRMAWQQAAIELGYSMSDDEYLCYLGRRSADCKVLLAETYGSHFPLDDFFTRGCEVFEGHIASNGIPAKAGLYELLDFLDSHQIAKAVATSTGRSNALSYLGALADRFESIVTGDEVNQGKPAPDIFLLAAKRLGLAPEQCLVLEDAHTGVQAAYAANIPVIMVPDLRPPSDSEIARAACVCSSLHEVKALLMKHSAADGAVD